MAADQPEGTSSRSSHDGGAMAVDRCWLMPRSAAMSAGMAGEDEVENLR
jgi:hypothetical protein